MQYHKFKNKKFISLLCLLLLGASLTLFCDRGTLVKIKYFLFTDKTSDKLFFTGAPNFLINNGFLIDSPESIKQWGTELSINIDYLKKLEQKNIGTDSTIEKAKLIALSFSKGGGGGCFGDIDLISKMKRISKDEGHGCCSDHSEVFIALCSVNNINSREVHNNHHVFNEIYAPEKNKWIWIDPGFTIMAQNSSGEYLSLFEIRELLFKDKKVKYIFFGNEFHFFYDKPLGQHEYFDEKNDFADIMVTWGNNVFEENGFYRHFNLLPKSVKQLIGLSFGRIPSYKIYIDKNSIRQ